MFDKVMDASVNLADRLGIVAASAIVAAILFASLYAIVMVLVPTAAVFTAFAITMGLCGTLATAGIVVRGPQAR